MKLRLKQGTSEVSADLIGAALDAHRKRMDVMSDRIGLLNQRVDAQQENTREIYRQVTDHEFRLRALESRGR